MGKTISGIGKLFEEDGIILICDVSYTINVRVGREGRPSYWKARLRDIENEALFSLVEKNCVLQLENGERREIQTMAPTGVPPDGIDFVFVSSDEIE